MKKLLLFVVLLLSFNTLVFGQFSMSVGPELGLNFNLHGGGDIDEGGSGIGLLLAGTVDMAFNRSRSLGIQTGFAFYDNRSGSSELTGQEQNVAITTENDVSISYFQIYTLFKFRLPAGIYFVFGPQIGFDLSAELESTQTIMTPGYYFQGGSTSQKSKNTIKDTNSRFELKMGGGFDIELSDLITLTPQLTFGFGLSDVVEDVDYSIHTFQLGVACKFNVIR
ncbi:MAG: outer membrane beta-barrel protein [Melioribacteraceae bacterium]|nr:outer membrane beta-barrel protein [Melioribacteraceae bacterium]